jgi:hypothetical protein
MTVPLAEFADYRTAGVWMFPTHCAQIPRESLRAEASAAWKVASRVKGFSDT